MAGGQTPNRERILGSIAMVFSHSKLKEVVGTDALKSVLGGQYRDLVMNNQIHLQVVWDLLADQPGFVAEDAMAPFCVLKTWEKDLEFEVLLPRNMAALTPSEMLGHASHCPIPKKDKLKAVNPAAARARARATIAALDEGTPAPPPDKSTRKPALEAALGLVAVLGLAYGGYSLSGAMGGAKFKTVQTGDIKGDLPIKKAKQLGKELSVLIEDATWYELPAKNRQKSVGETLENLKGKGIQSLIVQDASGALRATAQWSGSPPSVVVRLN